MKISILALGLDFESYQAFRNYSGGEYEGLFGVWPKTASSYNCQQDSKRRRKRHHCPSSGGKRRLCYRWICSSADFSTGLSRHLRHLSIIHHGRETNNNTMPGGFENSSMKTSFSLSSLQPSSVSLESPGQATLKDRPYSSLRKKPRRDPELDSWRRSWGSREENKDDAWNVLKQVNYQSLISDNNLIDSCQEASKDLLDGSVQAHEWNLADFTDNFLKLNEWLDRIQESVYSKAADSVMDKKLRLSHMEDMKRMDYRRKLFNNQGGRLVAREPNQKEEVAWRMVYLNSRWERLEAAVSLRKRTSADSDICPDVDQELRGLRKWIKETEKRLNVLKIRHNEEISARELEERSREEELPHSGKLCGLPSSVQ
ncbi:Hypothetical protein NTJ_06723 [Nesidiocoris tenuis]|uniref:Uncharacterized protein n=2 Tax=Nesidiocoris tenuis TaxID=355587 RepID=A0ABN7ARJ7_9HEMI|nr:Hypothetical protein NTJ_06723 [Nesidiocoris tenuis]